MESLTDKNKYFYKVVAKLFGKYFSIYNGQIEFELGQTYYQEAKPKHDGGFYVYEDLNKAQIRRRVDLYILNNQPQSLFIAPRTILKVLCQGPSVSYENGKIAFTYICPIEDIGMPKGYKLTAESKKLAVKWCEKKKFLKSVKPKQKLKIRED